MEFLLGSPFSSPVGQRIEKATDGSLQSENWALNMEICDIINETEEGPKDAFRAIKKRIIGNKNFHEVMLALTVSGVIPFSARTRLLATPLRE
uniref:VHS domain-containing protein n=1 Tax=Chelonoidis abingdonii TaxID=106734 RepID=A0A8C0G5P1_CHEAB